MVQLAPLINGAGRINEQQERVLLFFACSVQCVFSSIRFSYRASKTMMWQQKSLLAANLSLFFSREESRDGRDVISDVITVIWMKSSFEKMAIYPGPFFLVIVLHDYRV